MKTKFLNLTALLLAVCMMLPLAACGGNGDPQVQPATAEEVFSALLNHVVYATDLSDNSESAAIMYAGLPEGAVVTMYSGDARYADELTWIALAQESDFDAAMDIVDTHIDEKHDQFLSYHADEVPKIDGALIWSNKTNIILCISGDYDNAKALSEDPSSGEQSENPSEPSETAQGTEPDPTEPPTDAPTEPPATTPPITSDGSVRKYDNCMVVDNMAYEYYAYSDSAATSYANLVSSVAQALEGETTVYSLIIPTAIGVVFPDNLAEQYAEDQSQRLDQIFGKMDDSVVAVNIFDKLMQHRNEYLYYRTDWHWSAIGAYYGYERFCEVKGITPYTMDQRTEHVYEGYLGPFSSKDSAVAATPDTVYAYDPYFSDVSMVFTDANGNNIAWPVIADGDTYNAGSKYLIFAAGDQPLATFTNPNVTDGSVAIVVKESFGNAMMPYFPDHYSTVYEVDYRYWNGNLVDFARQVGAEDIIFANNIGMVRSSYLIGLMDKIIP